MSGEAGTGLTDLAGLEQLDELGLVHLENLASVRFGVYTDELRVEPKRSWKGEKPLPQKRLWVVLMPDPEIYSGRTTTKKK